MYKTTKWPTVTFSTWKSWYLLLNVFIRYGLLLLVANALLWPSIGFVSMHSFSFILALTLFEPILLFSIDLQGIKLTLNYTCGVLVVFGVLIKGVLQNHTRFSFTLSGLQDGDTLFEVSTVVSDISSSVSSTLPHSRKGKAYLRNCKYTRKTFS